MNPNITWDIVRDNSDKPWNYIQLNYTPNNPNTYSSLSENPNITWDIVKNNPNPNLGVPEWNYEELSLNKFTPSRNKFIKEYIKNHIDNELLISKIKEKIPIDITEYLH